MEHVMRFEEQRSKRWVITFILSIIVMISFVSVSFFAAVRILVERQTFALLEIFSEDTEIIAEFWRDTVRIFIVELPQKPLVLGGSMLLILLVVWMITRHRRKIIARRLNELAKRRKKRVS